MSHYATSSSATESTFLKIQQLKSKRVNTWMNEGNTDAWKSPSKADSTQRCPQYSRYKTSNDPEGLDSI